MQIAENRWEEGLFAFRRHLFFRIGFGIFRYRVHLL